MTYRALVAAAVLAFLGTTAAAQEECTNEAIQAKQNQLIAEVQELAASDPQKAQTLLAEFQQKVEAAAAADDSEAACRAFDEFLAQLEG